MLTRSLPDLRNTQSRVDLLQARLTTGLRIDRPSDFPADAVRVVGLQALAERQTQLLANTRADREFLAATDQALGTATDLFDTARGIVQAAIGDSSTSAEKRAFAVEIEAITRSLLTTANTTHRGDHLFAGSEVGEPPFIQHADGRIDYRGDTLVSDVRVEMASLAFRGVHGADAFGGISDPVGRSLNPALTTDTRLEDLLNGEGVSAGPITITLTDGATTQAQSVDLTGAETITDVEARIEDAFAGGPLTLDVWIAVDRTLRFTASAGTVEVADDGGSGIASQLGLVNGPAATFIGNDFDPGLSRETLLTSLNGGAGIGVPSGLAVRISDEVTNVDLSGATTIEDVILALEAVDPAISVDISESGDALAFRFAGSGVDFSISDDGSGNATALGLTTAYEQTRLDEFVRSDAYPLPQPLEVTLSDGTEHAIDLSTAETVQDVLDLVNAVAPGDLTATWSNTGNGIVLTDTLGGASDFEVAQNETARELGLTADAAGGVVTGSELNAQSAGGVFEMLLELRAALLDEDNSALSALAVEIDAQHDAFLQTRGRVGFELQFLERAETRLLDDEVRLADSLSQLLDADLAETVTELATAQTTLQATLQVTAQSFQLSLVNFL